MPLFLGRLFHVPKAAPIYYYFFLSRTLLLATLSNQASINTLQREKKHSKITALKRLRKTHKKNCRTEFYFSNTICENIDLRYLQNASRILTQNSRRTILRATPTNCCCFSLNTSLIFLHTKLFWNHTSNKFRRHSLHFNKYY